MRKLCVLIIIAALSAGCGREGVTNSGLPSPKATAGEAPAVVEGTINGGGGKGVLCTRDGVKSLETLDIYEARTLYNRKFVSVSNDENKALDVFATLLTRHLWNPDTTPMNEYKDAFKKVLKEKFLDKIRYLEGNKKLKLTKDSREVIVDSNCEAVQIAVYYDESVILIDKSLWDQLDALNRTALLAHELVYSVDRTNGASSSISTRKLVGQLFSAEGARPRADGVPVNRTDHARCNVSQKGVSIGYFYAFNSKREDRDGLEFVFNYFRNQTSLFRTSAFFERATLASFTKTPFEGETESEIAVESYPSKQSLKIDFKNKNRGVLYVVDSAHGTLSEALDVSCDLPREN